MSRADAIRRLPCRDRSCCGLVFLAFWVSALSGCSREDTALATWTPPSTFHADGADWVKSDSTKADEALLGRYFTRNDALAGSPALEGRRVTYQGSGKDRRFYWVSASYSDPRWFCIHYEKA